jgi:hypothetical protein
MLFFSALPAPRGVVGLKVHYPGGKIVTHQSSLISLPPIPPPAHIVRRQIQRDEKSAQEAEAKAQQAADDVAFSAFWANYPRKVGRGYAKRCWATALRKVAATEILAALSSYDFISDKKFILHPSSWLNGEHWLDEQPDKMDHFGINEWIGTLARDGGLSAHCYDPDELRAILIATGWEPKWRGSLDILGVWLRDGYVPDSIAKVIAGAVAEFGARGSLAAFDKRVRFRAQRIGS